MSNAGNANQRRVSAEPAGPAENEWGLFDPEQAGMPATMRIVREGENPTTPPNDERAPSAAVTSRTPQCRSCGESLPVDSAQCPRCSREVADGNQRGFELPALAPPASDKAQRGATYTLEFPTRCPHCDQQIRTFLVFRLLRSQVSFTSTLPRRGYVIVCPECERLLSAELSGLI